MTDNLSPSASGERRLACYGWLEEHAGSVASAGYVVLEELLRRGVRVDLFAHRSHVPPPIKLIKQGCRYFGFDQARWLTAVDRLPRATRSAVKLLLSPLIQAYWRRVYQPDAEAEHLRNPYDAMLTLGTTPSFTLGGVPHVTWLQSPFRTELEAVRRLRGQIISARGRPFYTLLVAYYEYGGRVLNHNVMPSEHVIVPSAWSRDALIAEGAPAGRTHALPYPVDLDAFSPGPEVEIDDEHPVLLSLGRLDPRKRLDLLLDAFKLVRDALPGARLRIVGRPGYAPRQLWLIESHPHRDAIEYRPPVPRQEVPSLLREAAVMVQTSENENFGSAVAESLACGTPVVVGPSNGTADYIDPNSTMFDAYTPGSVAKAVLETLQARRERPREVRDSTRAAAERWFAAPVVADRLLGIIEAAIAGRRAAAA